MNRRLLLSILVVALTACSGEEHQDIRAFMQEAERTSVPKIDPLPEAKTYEPFEYTGFELPDPFKPRSLKEQVSTNSNYQPDLNRRKEPLESYPLESLRFVGTIERDKTTFALVNADNVLHRVRTGNFMGQDYGEIVSVSDTELKVKERVQDSNGEWTVRDNTLTLIEEAAAAQEKK